MPDSPVRFSTSGSTRGREIHSCANACWGRAVLLNRSVLNTNLLNRR